MPSFLDPMLESAKAALKQPEGDPARKYLAERGVTPEQIEEFSIGYCPKRPNVPQGQTKDERFFRAWSQDGEKVAGKLLFPFRNARGHLLGFEVKSPSHSLKDYDKFTINRITDGWFLGVAEALPHVWEKRVCYVTEGIFDFFPFQQIFPNTVCTVTARIGDKQMDFMLRYCRTVVFVYDNDAVARRRIDYVKNRYGQRINVVQMSYPDGDINDLWKKRGQSWLREHFMLQKRRLLIDFMK